MALVPMENIEEISGPLGADIMIRSWRKTAQYFSAGLEHLRKAVAKSEARYRAENRRDIGICQAGLLHLLSGANFSEFIVLRNRLPEQPQGSAGIRQRLIRILQDEQKNTRLMLELMTHDSRIGYEGSTGYFYTPVEMMEKMMGLKQTLKQIRNSVNNPVQH